MLYKLYYALEWLEHSALQSLTQQVSFCENSQYTNMVYPRTQFYFSCQAVKKKYSSLQNSEFLCAPCFIVVMQCTIYIFYTWYFDRKGKVIIIILRSFVVKALTFNCYKLDMGVCWPELVDVLDVRELEVDSRSLVLSVLGDTESARAEWETGGGQMYNRGEMLDWRSCEEEMSMHEILLLLSWGCSTHLVRITETSVIRRISVKWQKCLRHRH